MVLNDTENDGVIKSDRKEGEMSITEGRSEI